MRWAWPCSGEATSGRPIRSLRLSWKASRSRPGSPMKSIAAAKPSATWAARSRRPRPNSPPRRRSSRRNSKRPSITCKTRRRIESLAHESYVWVKPYLDRWLPNDAFQTLVLVMVVLLVGTVLKGLPGDRQQRARGPAGQPGHVRPAQALLSPHLAVGPGHLQRRRLVGPDEPLHPRHVQHRQRTGDGFWKTDRRAA